MRNVLRHSALFILLLCPAFCWAQKADVTHDFDDLILKKQIEFSNKSKVAHTSQMWYTCEGGAVFGQDISNPFGSKRISINLTDANHMVTTSAVDSLARIEIWYYPATTFYATNIQLQVSRDSTHWSSPIVSDGMYADKGKIVASFTPGRYYVRLTNTSSDSGKRASIYKIKYSFGYCNCFMYIP